MINLSGLKPITSKVKKNKKITTPNELLQMGLRQRTQKLRFTSQFFDITKIEKQAKELGIHIESSTDGAKLLNDIYRSSIRQEVGYFYKQGLILSIIKDKNLYIGKYETFEQFVKNELDFSIEQAYQLLRIVKVIDWPQAQKIGDRVELIRFICKNKWTENIRELAIERIQELDKHKLSAKKIVKELENVFEDKDKEKDLIQEIESKIEDDGILELVKKLTNKKVEQIYIKNVDGKDVDTISELIGFEKTHITVQIHELLYIHILLSVDSQTQTIGAYVRYSTRG